MALLLSPARAAETLGVNRATLDRLAAMAPRDLPGGPIQVGFGSNRRHDRYPADTLLDWFRAASEAVNTTPKRTESVEPVLPPKPVDGWDGDGNHYEIERHGDRVHVTIYRQNGSMALARVRVDDLLAALGLRSDL